MRTCVVIVSLLLFPLMVAYAGEADVISVKVMKLGDSTYKFDVTVSHNDEGWNHYVNKWDVVGSDGTVYGTRTLYHPHVDEQPFTRSLSGVKIPKGISKVTVRAHDSVHEYGGEVVTIVLPRLNERSNLSLLTGIRGFNRAVKGTPFSFTVLL